jgi:hypothetical protein
MNDNLLIAAVLREVADQLSIYYDQDAPVTQSGLDGIANQLRYRAAELDPPPLSAREIRIARRDMERAAARQVQ